MVVVLLTLFFFCVITGYCCLGVCVLDLLFGCVDSFVGLGLVYVVWRCGLVGAFGVCLFRVVC